MSEISLENERFIQKELAKGAFRTRSEVLNAGVDLLRMREDLLAQIDEARRQLDRGEYAEYDEKGLRNRFGELKARVRHLGRDGA